MPQRRRMSALAPSQWEKRVYGGLVKRVGVAKAVGSYLRKANPVVRDVAKKINTYIPKGKSTLMRKIRSDLGTKRKTWSRGTQTEAASATKTLEGQTVKLNKVQHINIGGSRQVVKLPPALDPLWTKHMFQFTRADRATLSEGQGMNALVTTQDLYLPLHVYELTWLPLHADNNSYSAGRFLQNGTWETLGAQHQFVVKDVENGTGVSDSYSRVSHWLHHQVKIRMLLYGRTKQSTHYQIIFFRCKSEDNIPLLDSAVASAKNNVNLQRNTWFPRLAKFTTNPVYIGHEPSRFRGDKNNGIEVLRTFNYFIKEQLGTEDSVSKLNINITAHINKIKNHVYNENLGPLDGDVTGTVPQGAAFSYTNATKSAKPSQRIFMAIMASNYEMEGDPNYESPSYDISMQSIASACEVTGWPI